MTIAHRSSIAASQLPTCQKTGLILPLRTSLGSSEFAQHQATVAVELEILAKKFDRFGWERDRGSAAQDGMIRDWIEALGDFPLDEVRAACRAAVLEAPNRMPNEGHIRAQIMAARRLAVAALPKPAPEPDRDRCTPAEMENRRRVAASIGLKVFGGGSQ